MICDMKETIRRWWEGRYVPPDPNTLVIYLGHYEKHWTARAVQGLIAFYLAHWKWLIGTAIAICGMLIALFTG